jgi:hypothetical protein
MGKKRTQNKNRTSKITKQGEYKYSLTSLFHLIPITSVSLFLFCSLTSLKEAARNKNAVAVYIGKLETF